MCIKFNKTNFLKLEAEFKIDLIEVSIVRF